MDDFKLRLAVCQLPVGCLLAMPAVYVYVEYHRQAVQTDNVREMHAFIVHSLFSFMQIVPMTSIRLFVCGNAHP